MVLVFKNNELFWCSKINNGFGVQVKQIVLVRKNDSFPRKITNYFFVKNNNLFLL